MTTTAAEDKLEQVKIKIAKCLALATDPAATDGERAAAEAQAQKLMLKWNVERWQAEGAGDIDPSRITQMPWNGSYFGEDWEGLSRKDWWIGRLLYNVGQANMVDVYYKTFGGSTRTYWMVGREEDIEFVRELTRSLENFLRMEWEPVRKDRPSYVNGTVWKQSFFAGANSSIMFRFEEMREEREKEIEGSQELVLHSRAAIDRFYDDQGIHLGRGRVTSSKIDYDSYSSGTDAGSRADLSGGIGKGYSGELNG